MVKKHFIQGQRIYNKCNLPVNGAVDESLLLIDDREFSWHLDAGVFDDTPRMAGSIIL